MRDGYRVLDFRNRPPLPAFAPLFEIKRELLGAPLKRFALECRFRWLTKSIRPLVNRGAATLTPSMQAMDGARALRLWWEEIDAAGIDAVVCTGRLSDDRGRIDCAHLRQLQLDQPGRFFGLAPVDLDEEPEAIAYAAERAVREFGLRAINIEPAIRRRRGPTHVDVPEFYPLYEAMSSRDVAIMVYTSPFAGPTIDTANDMRPYTRVLDRFPRLKLILGHGGYPRVREVIATARRYPGLHVCQDIYSFWPGGARYLRSIESLQDQFLFGTSYPFSSLEEPLAATLRLPLSREAMEKYLWSNGARLLALPPLGEGASPAQPAAPSSQPNVLSGPDATRILRLP